MAVSKCPKCEGMSFELVENSNVIKANFKIMFIQCALCGTVVGTTDYYNTPSLIKNLAEKLGVKNLL